MEIAIAFALFAFIVGGGLALDRIEREIANGEDS